MLQNKVVCQQDHILMTHVGCMSKPLQYNNTGWIHFEYTKIERHMKGNDIH